MLRYHVWMRKHLSEPYVWGALIVTCWVLLLLGTEAYIPTVVEDHDQHAVTVITEKERKEAYYGTLADFPHMYEIRSGEPFVLSVEVLVPDTDTAQNTVSGIIIRDRTEGRGVDEVARLLAKDARWNSFYEWRGGDWYREGASFEKEVDPGVYHIEVSTPENRGQYVLRVGSKEQMGDVGYFERMGRIMEVKHFLGKSPIRVLESLYVLLPTLLILSVVVWYWRRKNMRNAQSSGL